MVVAGARRGQRRAEIEGERSSEARSGRRKKELRRPRAFQRAPDEGHEATKKPSFIGSFGHQTRLLIPLVTWWASASPWWEEELLLGAIGDCIGEFGLAAGSAVASS